MDDIQYVSMTVGCIDDLLEQVDEVLKCLDSDIGRNDVPRKLLLGLRQSLKSLRDVAVDAD